MKAFLRSLLRLPAAFKDGERAGVATSIVPPSGMANRIATRPDAGSELSEELMSRFNALVADGRLSEAVELLEGALGLSADDYRDPAKLARWREEFFDKAGDEPHPWLAGFLALINALGIVYRVQDSQRLLAAFLDLDPAALGDPDRVARGVAESALPRDPSFRVAFAMAASSRLGITGQTATGLRLLEQAAGIEKEDYSSPQRCIQRLKEGLDGVDSEVRTAWLTLMTASLLDQKRAHDALTLFAADLGWSASLIDASPELLVQALKKRLAEISGHGVGTYPRGLARSLAASGEPEHAAAVLEVYAGLDDSCYERPAVLASRLHQLLARTTDVTGLSFISELIGNLKEAGQVSKAAFLLRVYIDQFLLAAERTDTFDEPPLADFTSLFELWLEFFSDEPGPRPFAICRRLVEQIRRSLGSVPELEDRRAFLRTLGSLRRRLLTVGHRRAAGATDPEQRRTLFSEIVVWDAELSQRLLLERFLLGERHAISAGDPPEPGRRVAERLRSWVASRAGFLEEGNGVVGEVEVGLAAVLSVSEKTSPTTEGLTLRADDASLAAALGRDALLLRAAFDPDGRLLWSLWTSKGKRLEILDHGRGGDTDLEDLRWAVARHDFALELLRTLAEARGPGALAVTGEVKDLESTLTLLVDTLRVEAKAPTAESQRLLDSFQDFFQPPTRQVADILADLLRHLEENIAGFQRPRKPLKKQLLPHLCRPLFTSRPDDPVQRKTWAALAAAQIEGFAALVLSIRGTKESLPTALDSATRRFLDEVSKTWCLDRLALPPDCDVVLQVDDLLHSVPLAFLPVGGRPLYQQARSIRTSLGLLMDVSQVAQEKAAGPSPGRLLTLSHDNPELKALPGMAALHLGLERIGEDLGLETWAAAADPPATAGTLRAALDAHSGFDVVAICGHGHAVHAGVALAASSGDPKGELWQGAGCDLSGVDWLFMVSCSIGRVEQTGERDAEGFAVELALHGARSVAAFRWRIASREAAAFTTEAVGRYLRSRRQGMTGPLRARALNEARRAFLDGRTDPLAAPQASLHTIAACELYGLG